jgi:electron transfer flavoprotein alpha subunit
VAAAGALAAFLGGDSFVAGLFGERVQEAANRIAGCGASRFLGVQGPDFGQPRYGTDAAAAEAICRAANATIIIVSGTSRMARIAAGLGFRLGGRSDTHVTALGAPGGSPAVNRWYYRQRMEAVLQRAQRPWIVALDPGCLEPWKGEAGSANVESVPVDIPEACRRTKVLGLEAPSSDVQTIRPDAHLLFVAGAGWTKKQADGKVHGQEAEKLILEFLGHSMASLGGSKSLVDLSGEGQSVLRFMTHLNQIGQTGSTPRHPKGLATCCHGEEPHVVGWRFVSERRAVNLDPNCGWARGKADVVYVADAFAVMAKVNELLRERAAKS